ncbi:MAG: 5-methylcytosine restriction system specificity protein McrC, partial [Bacteroidales bacterium]
YRTREHNYDNRITQLVRHTIEHIRKHEFGKNILTNNSETQNCISQIVLATPNYDKNKRQAILNSNIKSISHPYFYEYTDLQRICKQILRYEGLKYGKEQDKVYGLLFDGAWLWEEYLNTILTKYDFIHPENKVGKNAIYLFENNRGKRYPDFWKNNMILDAKYKRLSSKDGERMDRNDMHQIISYMYVKKAIIGGFICPTDEITRKDLICTPVGVLQGYGGEIKLWTIPIPQSADNFNNFCSQMTNVEREFEHEIELNLNP